MLNGQTQKHSCFHSSGAALQPFPVLGPHMQMAQKDEEDNVRGKRCLKLELDSLTKVEHF